MALIDSFQSYAASAGRTYRGIKRTLVSGATSLTGFAPFVPHHLEIALQDLRLADVSLVREFYGGRFLLAGKLVETGGRSPFSLPIEHEAWQQSLQSFSWLRHFSASSDPVAGAHAKALVRDWIELNGGFDKEAAWNMATTARRLISWLNHSIVVLSSPDHEFHEAFMRSLGAHVRFLKRYAASANNDFSAILAYTALSYASICFSGHANALNFAFRRLDQELQNQVLTDGSHVSRNPQTNVDLLTLLLPLRVGCISAGKDIPPTLVPAIERLLQGLRAYRLGDGHLCRFNGSGLSEIELITAIQRYDETLPQETINSTIGSYERLHANKTILIMDTGQPPRGELSRLAHAGCLSFEFSSDTEAMVVNAGRFSSPPPATPSVWRTTAAHSTAVFNETSSCKFENTGMSNDTLRGQLFGSALKVESERVEESQATTVKAAHYGYARDFGARHERTLTLTDTGDKIIGQDWFSGSDKSDLHFSIRDAVTVHFHLHPLVEAQPGEDENSILLKTRAGQIWIFRCEEIIPSLEESIFFASISGAKPTQQIALHLAARKTPIINWAFKKRD